MRSFLLFLFCLINISFAQTKISGKVSTEKGESLPSANVFLKDTYDGISTDGNGNYSFDTFEEGEGILVASFIGYKSEEQKITLGGGELIVDFILKEEAGELDQVVISAGSFEASDENKAVILRPLDIFTTGSDADIYSALETLPGTQQVGETEGLFVRGGAGSETITIIDDMVVQKPFYSSVPDIPSRGRFSPALFKGVVFSTGGYSAQYGQALSSALILKTEDLANQTITSINLMPLGFGASHIQVWEDASMAGEVFYSNLKPYFEIQKQRTDWDIAPRGFDASFNYRQKISESGMLKVLSTFSTGDLSLHMENLDSLAAGNISYKDYFGLKTDNYYFNVSYRDILGEDWTFFGGGSFSYDKDKIDFGGAGINRVEKLSQGRITLTKNLFSASFLTFGSEVQNVVYEDSYNQLNSNINEVLSAGYVEADIFFTNDIAARIGVRAEHSKILDKSNIAPRLSLAYRVSTYGQFNFAYGNFFQTPQKDYLMQTVYTPASPTLFDYEKATHYILNFQHIDNNRTFRAEIYYKDYDKLAKGTLYNEYPFLDLPEVPLSNNGYGYAKGIDIFWRDQATFDYMDYWVSYSYLDTKRDFSNYLTQAFPTFATPHTFSVVAKRWFHSITTLVGITYTFATGRPFYNPHNPEFLGDRAKNYNNLSLNFSHLLSVFGNFTVIFFSVDNLLGFSNVYGYRYSSDGTVNKPILPQALRTAFIGMFISLGETNPY